MFYSMKKIDVCIAILSNFIEVYIIYMVSSICKKKSKIFYRHKVIYAILQYFMRFNS